MNIAFALGALLALAAAAGHSVLGERWILSKLADADMPQLTRYGRGSGLRLIRITWHLLSVAFVGGAVALAVQAFGPADEAAGAVGRAVAVTFFGFVVLCVALAIRAPRMLRHPAWLMFLATAALAWWGGA
ncbi:MAG: hypothetical protein WD770_10980 [Actinomycetota bacterium]